MPAAEDVQRQIAIAVVIAVEGRFLFAVDGIVGGIEVSTMRTGGHRWASRKRSTNSRSIAPPSWSSCGDDPGRSAGVLHAMSVDAGERAARLVEHGGERRVVPQRVVVDQVLVARAADALAQQIWHRMTDRGAKTQIGETTSEPPASPIARSAAASSTTPPIDVMAPPSKAPTSAAAGPPDHGGNVWIKKKKTSTCSGAGRWHVPTSRSA